MPLSLAFLSSFAAAPLALIATRVSRRSAGWVLGAVPAGLLCWFAFQAPAVLRGEFPAHHVAWVPELGLAFALRLDGLSLLMGLLITGMGALVFLYAGRYLGHHAHLGRFYGWLFLFMGGMLGIVLADDALLLFICWEVTTFSSFILIGFEHKEEEAREAALRALLITALGGQALLVGLVLMGDVAGTLSLSGMLEPAAVERVRGGARYLPILLLVLAGTFTKSAQVPFHTWLPGAMTAPTPVSAYLHAATMVKAGVYLLARLAPALGGTPAWEWLLTGVGAVTMVSGALLALGHTDFKLLLAYVTVSVLGLLVLLLGQGTAHALQAMVVFLTVHALYKGALFLVAGVVDHEAGTRELPQVGGLLRRLPLTGTASGVAALSMMGVPPLFGFVGKELVYEACLKGPGGWPLALAAALGFALMVAAALRAGVRPFVGGPLRAAKAAEAVHEAPVSMWVGPVLLAAAGLALGLVPSALEPLLGAAAAAAGGPEAGHLELKLWHGLTPALGLSAASLTAGGALFALREPILRGLRALHLGRWGPERVYQASLEGLKGLAQAQTRVLQSGSLRRYLAITLATLGGLLALVLGLRLREVPAGLSGEILLHEAAVLGLMLTAVGLAILTRSVLTSLMALGAVGLAEALVYTFFSAPDLAMTQVVMQTLTIILFALVFSRFPVEPHEGQARGRHALLAVAVGGLITWVLLHGVAVPPHTRISHFYATHTAPQAHGLNIVNVILVDFRALDTLGEVTVLATSSMGVYLLFRMRKRQRRPV